MLKAMYGLYDPKQKEFYSILHLGAEVCGYPGQSLVKVAESLQRHVAKQTQQDHLCRNRARRVDCHHLG